jgi:diguanylate cyclase (GGDEF)-like protein
MSALLELAAQPQILVIDDEPDNFDVIEALLYQDNYQLSYAASGQQGLDRLATMQPDVILLDVMMPNMDGIDFCRRVKQHAQWQHIPIIMVTALNGKDDLVKCMEAGANDFISKPVNGLELRARTRSMVRISQQYQNIQGLCERVQAGNEHLENFNKMLDEEVQERTAQLQQMIYQDALTHLSSRAALLRQLQKVIRGRADAAQAAIFYLDCDDFRLINSSWGYEVGNKLLVAIADRLKNLLQPTDFLARLGADEFCFVRKNVSSLVEIKQLASEILGAFQGPFKIDDRNIFVTASLGLALDHPRYEQAEQIIQDANTAMQRAKAIGPGRYHSFDIQMQEDVQERLQIHQDLYYSLVKREMVVSYQPIVDLQTGHIHSLESQVTWHHPQRGLMPSAEFLPYMEETGLSIQLGLTMLRQACQQLQILEQAGLDNITIQVPLSVKQFSYPYLLKEIEQLLTHFAIAPQRLGLDITEDAISQNPAAADIIKHLRTHKFQINIDNFGSESSSLQNLHQIVVDNIKIDRTFLQSATLHPRSAGILQAIIKMAQTLDTSVTVTGIEHQSQLSQLRELGCRFGQGALCAPVIETTDLVKALKNNTVVMLK